MRKIFSGIIIGLILGIPMAFAISKFFSDVPQNAWYANAVASLSDKGIVSGYSDGTFRPGNNVNRAEVAVMLDKAITYIESKGEATTNEWSIIKQYVTSKYPISESYFDTHFKFVSATPGQFIQGDYDYNKNEFSKILTNVTVVKYVFVIEDTQNVLQSFSGLTRIYLHNNEVIDSGDIPAGLSDYARGNFLSSSYDHIAPTRELHILKSRNEAVNIAKSSSECTNATYFNIKNAENNLDLQFLFGEIAWIWQDGLSYCRINAETGKLYDTNLQLPDAVLP